VEVRLLLKKVGKKRISEGGAAVIVLGRRGGEKG